MIETFQCPFKNNVTKGFQMTFANGNTISVQFGKGNYCSNRNESNSTSQTAEIAIWNSANVDYIFDGGNIVKGWCDTNEIAKWFDFAANTNF